MPTKKTKRTKLTLAQKACRVVDPSLPFSLECCDCDAGMGVESPESALLAGWAYISPNDSATANYMGQCPRCQIGEVKCEIRDRRRRWANSLQKTTTHTTPCEGGEE